MFLDLVIGRGRVMMGFELGNELQVAAKPAKRLAANAEGPEPVKEFLLLGAKVSVRPHLLRARNALEPEIVPPEGCRSGLEAVTEVGASTAVLGPPASFLKQRRCPE